uniref:Ubiquitin-like protease family profile domain-containing protein n=1 Tax=Lactuca sativa TaxID=4236 RepID=A0A9R1VIW0_LACSA|nr:hypothetical protein LSAT_V11C500268330 [Lactuca sativa]
MNTKAFANLKGSGGNIWEVFEVLDDARRAIFRNTVFGYFIDVPRLQGDALLFHKMFLHQIRPDPVLSPDGIKRLYFRVGNTKMVYGPEEFCLITGFNFGEYPKNIRRKGSEKLISSKKRCLLRERLFPDHTNSSVKIGDLKSLILNQTFLALDDLDAVRVCLIYILCEGFLGKEVNDRVPQDWFFLAENLDLCNSFSWGSYLWDFTFVDLEDTWNKINHYLSLPQRGQTLKYSVSGFTAPIRIWIYEMIPAVRACGFALRKNKDLPRMKRWSGTKKLKWVDVNKIWSKMQGLPPRQNMLPGDGEMTSFYYMSFQEYVYGEGKAVPSPVRDHFRRQDESSSSMSSSGRSHGRGRGSGKHKLDELLKRVHALEQHVFMNQQKPTEVFVEEVNNEQFWNDIIFEEPTVSQRNYDEQVSYTLHYLLNFINIYEYLCSYFIFENIDEVMNKNNTTQNVFGDTQDDKVLEESTQYAGNKFDDDVCDVNDYSEVKEEWEERNDNAGNKFDDDVSDEDELIIMGNVDYFHDDDDDKEVTPDKPRSRKPSQFLCTPYTELHTTPKQKRRTKKKVGMKSTSPVPPPVFGVAHDFSRLRLQPYVAGGEDVIQNYVLHSYDVQHRLFNFVLDRDFWSSLFGHTHDGWLESAHITIWYRLLMERRFESDRHTIMPPNFFCFSCFGRRTGLEGVYGWYCYIPQLHGCLVLLPIHSSPNHWLFGELRLASMEVHIYDSLGRGAYEKFQSEGIFSKFERRVANYLDKIKYWARRNIPRIPLNMQFIYEENVPQQSSHLGDCGVFLCMFMEQLVSGQPIRVLIDPKNAALEFRLRMAKIIWGSSLAPL